MSDRTLKEKIVKVRDLEVSDKDHIDAMYSKPSHRERKRILLEIMANYVKGKDFLDVGCAEGIYCNEAYKLRADKIMGLDISNRKIDRAKKLFPQLEFKVMDSDNISSFSERKFDFILCTEVLQHILDYKKTLREIVSILNISGYFLISAPNLSKSERHSFADINSDMTVEELLAEIGGAGFGKQNAIWKFNTDSLKEELLRDYPLELVEMVPVDTPDGEIRNLWTIFLLRKKE